MDANRKPLLAIYIVTLILIVLMGQPAAAMGLGNIKVTSSLNEPLSASIPVFKDSSEANISSTDLIVSIANPDLHRNAGLAYPAILNDLRFNIVTDSNGQLMLNIYSVRTVYEPLLNFLVDLRWNGGQLVKEYSLILDPISYTAPSSSTVNREAPNSTVNNSPSASTRPRTTTRVSRPVILDGDTYQVQSGDSLSKIAMAVRAEQGGNLNEIMQSIYAANPEAFLASPDQLLANVQIVIPQYYSSVTEPAPRTQVATESVTTSTPLPDTTPAEPVPVTTPENLTATVSQPRLEILPPDEIIKDAAAIAGESNTNGTKQVALTEQAMDMLAEEQQRNTKLETRNADLEQRFDELLESNKRMQLRLDQLIQTQQQPQSNPSNYIRYLPWLLLGLLSLFMGTLLFKRKQQAQFLPSVTAPEYQAQATSTQRMVADLDAYNPLDSDAEPAYDATSEGLLDEDQLIDDLATSQELYEPTSIIDADMEATQTFMGSLDDVDLDAGQNLDAAQEAEIYLAYQQYKLADKTIHRLIESEPENYKFQILKLQLLAKTGKMEELQELSVELLSRFPNRDDEVHQRIQEICDMAFSANMGGQALGTARDAGQETRGKVEPKTEPIPEYEDTKEIEASIEEAATEPGLELTAMQDDITEFLNEDLTLSDTDPMLISSIIDHEMETEINPDVEYTDISDQLTELMDDITEEGLDLPFDLETEILQEEEKRKILDQHNPSDEDKSEEQE